MPNWTKRTKMHIDFNEGGGVGDIEVLTPQAFTKEQSYTLRDKTTPSEPTSITVFWKASKNSENPELKFRIENRDINLKIEDIKSNKTIFQNDNYTVRLTITW